MPEKAIKMLKKIFYITLILFLAFRVGYSEQSRVKIILENGYYYTQLETGEKFKIVKQVDWALNKIVFSPDGKYLAYTTSNGLGFENKGRDVFYCKVDGSERIFLHKFDLFVDSLLWDTYRGKDFIFVIFEYCHLGYGGIQIIDIKSGNIILTLLGDSLSMAQGEDCYQLFCFGELVQKGRDKICLEDLLTIKEPDSLNVRFFAGWSSGDIYISNKRDPLLRFGDPKNPPNQDELSLRSLLRSGEYPVSKIIPNIENNRIAFYGKRDNFGFFGTLDLENKKLLLFDLSDSLKFSYPIWSPDGCHLALLRKTSSRSYIDFYGVGDEGKMVRIKTHQITTDRPVTDFEWSKDSNTFYFSIFGQNNQKIKNTINVDR